MTLTLINAIGKLGEPAVMPLVRILEDNVSLSDFELECICRVLGELHDSRAIGVLKKASREARLEESREYAIEALDKIKRWKK